MKDEKSDTEAPRPTDAPRPMANRQKPWPRKAGGFNPEAGLAARAHSEDAPPAPVAEQSSPARFGTVAPMQLLFKLRAVRRRKLLRGLGLFSVLPAVLIFFYMYLIASPRYITRFEITYQTYQPQQSLATGLVQTVLGSSAGSTVDLSTLLYEYIRSPALMQRLDEKLKFRSYYSNSKVDYLSRLNPNATTDNALTYLHWYISVTQGEGGYLIVTVEAFDRDYALALAKEITKACDEMVDQLTVRAREDAVRAAEELVRQSQLRVNQSQAALTDFQNQHGDLSPQNSAAQVSAIVGSVEGDLSKQRALLGNLMMTSPGSPQVKATQTQIAALEAQLKHEQRRLANGSTGTSYSNLLEQYSALQLQLEFAKSAFLSAQQGLSVAIAGAANKQNYLIDFAPAHQPDNLSLKVALYYAFTTLITTIALYGVASLLAGAIRDQASF